MKNNKNKLKIGISVFLLIAMVGGGLAYWNLHETKPVEFASIIKIEPKTWSSKLDGSLVVDEQKQTPLLLGVMIDNHADARAQQAGLSQARVVYEALAEGGITRYLALFNAEEVIAKVGPVRSARPYYLNWIREYGDSTYWHSGGSPDALAMIKQLGLPSTNEFSHGQYYWRDRAYDAPHNLFTSQELWIKLLDVRGSEPSMVWKGWLFATSTPVSTSTVKGVTIMYSPDYKVSWKFEAGRYKRLINSREQTDGGKQIMADTIIIQEVKTKILDEVGRKELSSVGSGKASVLKQGVLIRGTWKKEVENGRTRFTDEAGNEIPLAPGQIWLQIVPINTSLEITS